MKASDSLFRLIKSLTKTEKAYFKKYSERHSKSGVNNYSLLFDELNSIPPVEAYSEDKVRNKFRNMKFAKQLPVTKNYLYSSIMRSLVQYHEKDSADISLNRMIDSAGILYMKGLFTQSIKITSSAREAAYKYGKYYALLSIIQIERKALRAKSSLNESSKELSKSYDEEAGITENIKNISLYERLFDEAVIMATARGISRNNADKKAYNKFLDNQLLKDASMAKTLRTKIIYHQVICFICRLKHEIKKAFQNGIKTIELIEKAENGKILAPYDYVIALQNIIEPAIILGKSEAASAAIKKLEIEQDTVLAGYPSKVKNFLSLRTKLYRISLNLSTGRFRENIIPIKNALELVYSGGNPYRDEIIVTNFNAAINYFACGEFTEALAHLNVILNSKSFPLREDLQAMCRMFNLMIHYELGNFEYVEHTISSTSRYLMKSGRMDLSSKLFLKALKELLKLRQGRGDDSALNKAKKELAAYWGKYKFNSVIDHRLWIESKTENISYTEALKKNFSNQ